MAKQLLIEDSSFLTRIVVPEDLKESVQIKQGKNNTLIVKNVPATILNRGNQNGRIYSTEEMQKALDAAKQQIATKQLLCQASEHPEGSFVSPTHASHVIIGAYIKKGVKLEVEGEKGKWDVLFCDIEVLNTQEGQNLQALLLSGVSCGTSIRGLGDMQGDRVINYEFLGFDVVSNPSSGTFTNMPIYEAKIESVEENALNEAVRYTVSTYASNTTHDLDQAVEFQNNVALNLEYGTITNIGTKMDQEIDPKTGVEKIVGEVEVETSDDTSELKSAIDNVIRAFTNPNNINVTSVTIEKVDDDDIKDSVETEEAPLQEDNEEETLYTKWKKVYGGKTIVVKTAAMDMGVFPSYDNQYICYGPINGGKVSYIEGQIEYDPSEKLEYQLGKAIDQVHAEYGFESDLLDSVQNDTEVIAEADDNIETQGNKVVTTIDDEKYEKDFDNEQQAQMAVSGVNSGKLDPAVVLPDEYEEDAIQEDATNELEQLKQHVVKSLESGDNKFALAMLNAINKAQQGSAIDQIKTNNETFEVDGVEHADLQNISNEQPVDIANIDIPENVETSEKVYSEPDAPSDDLVPADDVDQSDEDTGDVMVELSDLTYDIDNDSDFNGNAEEYDSILEALNDLPETIEVTINAANIPQGEDVMNVILDKAKAQTGLPIKNAKISNVKDLMAQAE